MPTYGGTGLPSSRRYSAALNISLSILVLFIILRYTLGHILPYMQEDAMHLSVALSVSNILSRQEAPFRGWLLSTHPS